MRRLVLIVLITGLGLAAPRAASAQAAPTQPSPTPADPQSAPAPPSSSSPAAAVQNPSSGTQTAPAAQAPAQPPAAPAAPATPDAAETPHSLFEPTWHEFLIGGRATSISGDPARFQRYQDVRDGIMFTGARYAAEGPEGDWAFKGTADNVGWRDQRYIGGYERTGKFTVSGI